MLLSAIVVAAIGAIAGLMIWHSRQSTLQEHQRAMDSMGVVLAEQTSRYAQVIDLVLRDVRTRITGLQAATRSDFQQKLATQDIHHYLAERLTNIPQSDAIVLVDADGFVVNGSRTWPAVRVDLSDRDYYKYFKEHDDPGIFVGAVSKSRGTGALSMFFARRVSAPDGQFCGLIVALVDIKSLSAFYQTAGERVKQAVSLLRRDGTMVMRYPEPEMAIGVKLPNGSPWYDRVAQGGGTYIAGGTLRTAPVLVSVHLLNDYPLVIDIVMNEADVFVRWHREAMIVASFAIIAAFAFVCLFWTLGRQFRRQAEQNARLDVVLNNITQGVSFFNSENQLLLSNRRYAEIYNLSPEATRIGCSLQAIMAHRRAVGSAPEMPEADYLNWAMQAGIAPQASSAVVAINNGRFIAVCVQPMEDGGRVITHEDITERQQAVASMAFMARHDSLTKLPNRVLFRERMEQAIAATGRGARFALICLDLDKFKEVNDTLGHPAGDALLVAVADRLQACVREGDIVARLGGDEFAIIQLGVGHADDADVLASRIIAAFEQPFDIDGHRLTAGTSLGITVAPDDGVSYETLMRNADIALYLAKTEGRGTARFFEPEMDARIHMRRQLELDLQGATARNEFELYYQPLVSVIANRIVGFEALLHWHHPVRGLISPLDFIPVAEETGMIVAIGEWALRSACFEAENWPDDISVAVNLSPVQFKKGDLVATVRAALAASGLRPDRLELEITESVLLRDTAATLSALHELRTMGICVALDDFGTGYSSLSYLRSFPFSKIKIDQSFVRDLLTNKESMSIVRAVTGLGQSLGIRTTAEGVETLEQLNRLREEGCIEVQGYFFSRPRPAGDLPRLIERLKQTTEPAGSVQV